jgi:hypothetical protein
MAVQDSGEVVARPCRQPVHGKTAASPMLTYSPDKVVKDLLNA